MTGPNRPPPDDAASGAPGTASDDADGPARVTSLAGLARHLRLSKGTVSRALNGYSDIAPATRARVAAAADALGYRASTTARRLAQRRVETVGLVVPVGTRQLNTLFLAEFLSGLTVTLGGRGYDLIVRSAAGDDPLADYRELIEARKVDGFVITRTRRDDPRVAMLMAADVPFVTYGRTSWPDRHAWLDTDGEQAFHAATTHLLALGHRRIGLISAGSMMMASEHRIAGYRARLAEAGLPDARDLIVEGDMSGDSGARAATALLAGHDRPSAILCANDMMALGAIQAIRRAGLRVPQDVSIIGFDGIAIGSLVDPALTTMTHDAAQAGARVAEMLLAILAGGDPTRQQFLVRASLVRRASDGPPPEAAAAYNDPQPREDTHEAHADP